MNIDKIVKDFKNNKRVRWLCEPPVGLRPGSPDMRLRPTGDSKKKMNFKINLLYNS